MFLLTYLLLGILILLCFVIIALTMIMIFCRTDDFESKLRNREEDLDES